MFLLNLNNTEEKCGDFNTLTCVKFNSMKRFLKGTDSVPNEIEMLFVV